MTIFFLHEIPRFNAIHKDLYERVPEHRHSYKIYIDAKVPSQAVFATFV